MTGRSRARRSAPVSAMSWSIGRAVVSTATTVRDLARRSTTMYWTLLPEAAEVGDRVQLARLRVALRMRGEAAGQRAVEVAAPMVSSSSVSSNGRPPASTMAKRLPAWPITLVFAAKSSRCGSRPPASGSPSAVERPSRCGPSGCDTTPPCRREAHAVDHAVAGEPVIGRRVAAPIGFGPLRRNRPSSQAGSVPVTGSSVAVELLGDRCEVALEIAVLDDGHWRRPGSIVRIRASHLRRRAGVNGLKPSQLALLGRVAQLAQLGLQPGDRPAVVAARRLSPIFHDWMRFTWPPCTKNVSPLNGQSSVAR